MTIEVKFMDSGREPKCPPHPGFPNGMDIDLAHGQPSCLVQLPYPAPRCGYMALTCNKCGKRVVVSVAGRADDPRTVLMPCRPRTVSYPAYNGSRLKSS